MLELPLALGGWLLLSGGKRSGEYSSLETQRFPPTVHFPDDPYIPGFNFSSLVRHAANAVAYDFALRAAKDPVFFAPALPVSFYCFDPPSNGCGATHLLHAMAKETRLRQPRSTLVSAPRLEANLMRCRQIGQRRRVRVFYENVEALFIDDIDFLSGKEWVQAELADIVQALLARRRNVAFTFANPLGEMQWCSEVLQSATLSGASVPIGRPDLAGRREILRRKANEWSEGVPDEVIAHLAERDCPNVRELEGMLRRALAHAGFFGVPVTIELVRSVVAL